MSAVPPECVCVSHMFVFVTPHLHLNAKSAGLSVCASLEAGEAGEAASGSGDEQTLQGRIISYYPQFPDAALRGWAQLDSSHGQKWVESLSRFIRPSQTPCPLPPPLLPPLSSCFQPSLCVFCRLLSSICPKSFASLRSTYPNMLISYGCAVTVDISLVLHLRTYECQINLKMLALFLEGIAWHSVGLSC